MWPGPGLPRDAVLDRVLDERLQHQVRHAACRASRAGRRSARPGDRRIASARSAGTSRGNRARPCSGISCWPMFSSVRRSRSLSRISVRSAASTSRCISAEIGVQRVEEEVRVQLLLQRLQLRLDEPRLELRRRAGRGPRTRGSRGARGSGRRSSSRSSSPSRSSAAPSAGPPSPPERRAPAVRASHHCTPPIAAMCVSEKTTTDGRWTSERAPEPCRSNRKCCESQMMAGVKSAQRYQ